MGRGAFRTRQTTLNCSRAEMSDFLPEKDAISRRARYKQFHTIAEAAAGAAKRHSCVQSRLEPLSVFLRFH